MKKSVEILGLPVISVTEGSELGKSKSLLIDAHNKSIAALTIEDEDWYRGVKLIPYESVIAIGDDAVIINNSENILKLEDAGDYENLLDENVRIIGTKAITKNGMIQGNVTELYVGESGAIEQCEITMPDGSTFDVPVDQISIFGKQVTVISANMEKKTKPVSPEPPPEPEEVAPPIIPMEEIHSEVAEEVFIPEPAESPAEEVESPAEEIPSEEIQTEIPTAEENSEVSTESPAEEIPTEIPTEEVEAPVAEIPTEEPPIEEAPVEEIPEVVTEAPAEEIPTEEVASEVVTELPSEEVEAPAEEIVTEIPNEEVASEEIQAEIPAEEVSNEIATEVPLEEVSQTDQTTELPENLTVEVSPEEIEAMQNAPVEQDLDSMLGEGIAAVGDETVSPEIAAAQALLAEDNIGADDVPVDELPAASENQQTTEDVNDVNLDDILGGLTLDETQEPQVIPEATESDAARSSRDNRNRFIVGKKAARTVRTDNGMIIVEAGATITDEVLQRAKMSGKMIALSMSVQ